MAFNRELFPEPTSPIMQTNSPFFTDKFISLKISDMGLSSSSGEFKISFCSAPQEKVPFSIFIESPSLSIFGSFNITAFFWTSSCRKNL